MTVGTVNPKFNDIIIDGNKITGYADGTYLNAVRNSDAFETVSGADGHVARAKTNDSTSDVTITLLQTSRSNAVLSAIAKRDEKDGSGLVEAVIEERNTGNKLDSAFVWVKKKPDIVYSKGIEARAWTLVFADVDDDITGN